MSATLEIVECGSDRREEALRLLTRLWSTDVGVNRAYWAWKYDRNPAAGDQRVYLALAGGRAIGMRGFIGARWELGTPDATAWLPCAGDTVVDRQFEGRGFFRAIMDVAQARLHDDGHPYMFNFSAGQTVFLRSLRGGWRAVTSYEQWHRAGRGDSPAGMSAKGRPERELLPLGGTARSAKGAPPSADAFDVAAASAAAGSDAADGVITVDDRPRPEAMAALVGRLPTTGRIRRVRDLAYFAWRFDNPLSRYWFLYHGGAALDGYLVLRKHRYRPKDAVKIIDAEAASPAILARLLDAAVRWFGAWPLEIWTISLGPEVRVLLSEAGFAARASPEGNPRFRRSLLVKATDPTRQPERWRLGPHRLLDPAGWDLRMLWSDGA